MFSSEIPLSFRIALFLILVSALAITGLGQSPYTFTVVAKADGSQFLSLDPSISINDNGSVAFFGQFNRDERRRENLFIFDGVTRNTRKLLVDGFELEVPTPTLNDFGQVLNPGIQINNQNIAIVRRRMNARVDVGGVRSIAPFTYIEGWGNGNLPIQFAMGDAEVGPAAPLLLFLNPSTGAVFPSPFVPNSPFGLLFQWASINNKGQAVFTGGKQNSGRTDRFLVTPITPPYIYNRVLVPGDPSTPLPRPVISDDGRIITRFPGPSGDEIRLYPYDLSSFITIAGRQSGFTTLGRSPSISDDGKVVVFYGDLTDLNKANEYETNTGPGVFVSIDQGVDPITHQAKRRIRRVAGGFFPDYACDRSIIFVGELGADPSGQMPYRFETFDPDERVSVLHHSGLGGESLIVCFSATPNAATPSLKKEKGIFTIRVDVIDSRFVHHPPQRVIQIGDHFEGQSITDVKLFDSLAEIPTNEISGAIRQIGRGDYRVAFWAKTNQGEVIVRGSYIDSDEDSLPDFWEEKGVTVDGLFIDLPGMGANPLHKDLFVHLDWMPERRVSLRAIRNVVDAFFIAPVANPDGRKGIDLHVDLGPDSLMDPLQGKTWGSLSRAGEVPADTPLGKGQTCLEENSNLFKRVDELKTSRFEPAKRAKVFHYAVSVYKVVETLETRGRTRGTPGADFVIGFGSPTNSPKLPSEIEQAGAFMHELGHNLGLEHGGSDDINYKPNYLSIMNYSFAYTGLCKPGGLCKSESRELNYSTSKLTTLNEFQVDEVKGINLMDGRRTRSRSRPCLDSRDNTESNWPLPLPLPLSESAPPQAIDWDCNRKLDSSPYPLNLRNDPDPDSEYKALQIKLEGHEDWSVLRFDGNGGVGGANLVALQAGLLSGVAERPIEEILAGIPEGILNAHQFAPVDNVTFSPQTGNFPLKVRFDGSASVDADGGTIVS